MGHDFMRREANRTFFSGKTRIPLKVSNRTDFWRDVKRVDDLQIFKNPEFGEIRTTIINDEPWFVGKDVCEAFGDTHYRRSISRLNDEEKGVSQINTPGGVQNMTIVNESGLYALLFYMQPEKAKGASQNDCAIQERVERLKRFKRWVTSEVLPSIRMHGVYATAETAERLMSDPDFMIRTFTALKEEREKRQALEVQAQMDKPKVLFADAVSTAHTSILVGELAKLLKQNGVDIGQNRLFRWMRDKGYLIRRHGTDFNMPTQRAMEMGLFEIKETAITHADGHTSVSKTPKVTGKGQQYFVERFLGGGGLRMKKAPHGADTPNGARGGTV